MAIFDILQGYSKAKWLQNGRFWERRSDQPTRWLIRPHIKDTGTSKWREHCHIFTWAYAIHSHEYGKNWS